MTTKKQIRANQRNAQKSTGPRTAEGTKVSSRNAKTHGLFAKDVVAACEDQEMFDALLEALTKEHQPETFTETLIVERIALAFWRERRLARAEKQLMDSTRRAQLTNDQGDWMGSDFAERHTLVDQDLAREGLLTIQDQLLIGRYQTMISNQLRQALKDLREERTWREKTIDAAPRMAVKLQQSGHSGSAVVVGD